MGSRILLEIGPGSVLTRVYVLQVVLDQLNQLVEEGQEVQLRHCALPFLEFQDCDFQDFDGVVEVFVALLRVHKVAEEHVNLLVELLLDRLEVAVEESDQPFIQFPKC